MRLLTFLLLFAACTANSQDITGVWHGHFRNGNMSARQTAFDDRYKFEVQIAQQNKKIEAVTYSYLSSLFYGKAAATGTVNRRNGNVILQEVKLLEVRNQSGGVCIMTCFLKYTKIAGEEFLEGRFISMNVHDSTNCGRGTVFLRKVPVSDFYKEPFLERREKEIEQEKSHMPADTAALAPPTVKTTTPPSNRPPSKKDAPPSSIGTGRDAAPNNPPVAKITPPSSKTSSAGKTSGNKTASPDTKTQIPAKRKPAADIPAARTPMPHAITPPAITSGKNTDSTTTIGKQFPVITPKVLQSRSNVLVRTIVVHSNDIELDIYDDGAIDHDTISVYLDKKQVLTRRMLTDRPIVLNIHIDESEDYHELVMVAENEGEIPPNTSLMIVKAGDKEYEVRITSTEQKNAMLIFRFEKK